MNVWKPAIIGLVLGILVAFAPLIMAMFDADWMMVGGFVMIVSIPAGAVIAIIGLGISLFLKGRAK